MTAAVTGWTQRLRRTMSGNGLRATIARASVAAVILKVLNTVLGFATTVVLARALGPDSLGVYAFALAVVMVVGLPAKAGVPQLVTRETAKGKATGEWGTIKAVWRWSTLVVLGVSAAVLLLALVAALVYPDYFRSEAGTTLAIGLLMIPLMGLALVRASSLRGLGHIVQGQLPELAIKPLVFLALLLGLLLVSSGTLTASWAMTLNIAATVTAFVVGAWMLRRVRPPAVTMSRPAYESRAWLGSVIPLATITAMHLVNTQADLILVGIFMESADVGNYKIAAQIAFVVGFGLHATKMVAEPFFARFYRQKDEERLRKLGNGISAANTIIALSIFLILLISGKQFIQLVFGEAFLPAHGPLLVLSAAWVVAAVFSASGQFLVMAGFENKYVWVRVFSVLVNIVLNLLMIPLFGLMGAAVATLVSMVIFYIMGWRLAVKETGIDFSAISLVKPRRRV
ncbi:oligosaccharide flippase family protein [Ectothiorhodospira haloalkaliphila]|uniref:oligosaccharide flippase family protein n=1 Tax=Ectothiorhodospira haloalkaliphila TaxID=421628 RepID=UPI001EE90F0F|nr:oligosaccharide flippase family protein [Ectothiorhodospira haloalkaliphila]MCG5525273.1 oligosaccharide flippase family protein [Ectothiorhodospira haloalkaliphila]